jgi:hypothetical protein
MLDYDVSEAAERCLEDYLLEVYHNKGIDILELMNVLSGLACDFSRDLQVLLLTRSLLKQRKEKILHF